MYKDILVCVKMGFNCTFMELKYSLDKLISVAVFGFNCTFMELKYWLDTKEKETISSFNCTFMELKYLWRDDRQNILASVLIVPLWNWNFINNAIGFIVFSFNCTFMELKFVKTGSGDTNNKF